MYLHIHEVSEHDNMLVCMYMFICRQFQIVNICQDHMNSFQARSGIGVGTCVYTDVVSKHSHTLSHVCLFVQN